MDYYLADKVAVITGGSRGIGAAVAKKFANSGCKKFIINYFNSSDKAEQLCAELHEMGAEAYPLQANVSDPKSVKEFIAQVKNIFGKIDLLISNAASGVLKPALKMSVKHWRWCLETNALALHLLAQHSVDLMSPGSRIIALSSLGANRAIPNYAFIGASKAALESLVRSLSLELAPYGISVNANSAGVVDTDSLKHFPNREELLETFKGHSLAGRSLEPEDVADAVSLLCRPEAEMIKGQTVFVDAGYSILG